jgi:hypothetical protein
MAGGGEYPHCAPDLPSSARTSSHQARSYSPIRFSNKGFACFITVARGSVTINRAALEADARLDGKLILHTNTELPAAEEDRWDEAASQH